MRRLPATTFEMIEAEFLFGFAVARNLWVKNFPT